MSECLLESQVKTFNARTFGSNSVTIQPEKSFLGKKKALVLW